MAHDDALGISRGSGCEDAVKRVLSLDLSADLSKSRCFFLADLAGFRIKLLEIENFAGISGRCELLPSGFIHHYDL